MAIAPSAGGTDDPPVSVEEYIEWLRVAHDVELGERVQRYHDLVVHRIRLLFEESSFWLTFTRELGNYDSQYRLDTGFPLFIAEPAPPEVLTKSFGSLLTKTFRKNVLENDAWPDPPSEGWILPTNWYEKANDVVRCVVPVKYIDGITFMLERLRALSGEAGFVSTSEMQARLEGYYAAHFYVYMPVELPAMTWDTFDATVSIEIQLTTQLQEVMRQLLHQYYEARRSLPRSERRDWQWDYKSEEFSANYLGHILHYVEGMIMEVRDRQREEEKEESQS